MSITVMSAVWHIQGLSRPTERLVLLKLADCAHDDGTNAFPKINTIARHCEVSRATVQRALRTLEDEGWIAVQEECSGYSPRKYRLVMGKIRQSAQPFEADPRDETPQNEAPQIDASPVERDSTRAIPEASLVTRLKEEPSVQPPVPENVRTCVATTPHKAHAIKEVMTEYDRLFTERYSEPNAEPVHPNITGKETMLAKQLIARHGKETVIQRLQQFFTMDDEFFEKAGYTFPVFAASWSKIVARTSSNGSGPTLISDVSKSNLASAAAVLKVMGRSPTKMLGPGGRS